MRTKIKLKRQEHRSGAERSPRLRACPVCSLHIGWVQLIFNGVELECDYNSNNGKTSYYLIHHLKIICEQQYATTGVVSTVYSVHSEREADRERGRESERERDRNRRENHARRKLSSPNACVVVSDRVHFANHIFASCSLEFFYFILWSRVTGPTRICWAHFWLLRFAHTFFFFPFLSRFANIGVVRFYRSTAAICHFIHNVKSTASSLCECVFFSFFFCFRFYSAESAREREAEHDFLYVTIFSAIGACDAVLNDNSRARARVSVSDKMVAGVANIPIVYFCCSLFICVEKLMKPPTWLETTHNNSECRCALGANQSDFHCVCVRFFFIQNKWPDKTSSARNCVLFICDHNLIIYMQKSLEHPQDVRSADSASVSDDFNSDEIFSAHACTCVHCVECVGAMCFITTCPTGLFTIFACTWNPIPNEHILGAYIFSIILEIRYSICSIFD